MRSSRVLAVPSVTARNGDCEGLPTVIVEALGHGIPVIAFDHGGIGEIVMHGVNGLLAPEGDTHALASHLSAVLRDDVRRLEYGRNGRALVERDYDVLRQTRLLEELYDGVLRTSASRQHRPRMSNLASRRNQDS